jgi:hypothetical protein
VAEEAPTVLLTSGGNSRKRKRDKAARLRPVAEDAASTTQLFNGNGHARHGRSDTSTSSSNTAGTPLAPNGSTPLLRYEWRSAAGETLVVEAGWPAPDRPPDPEQTVTTVPASPVTVTEPAIVVDHPRLDLRN